MAYSLFGVLHISNFFYLAQYFWPTFTLFLGVVILTIKLLSDLIFIQVFCEKKMSNKFILYYTIYENIF